MHRPNRTMPLLTARTVRVLKALILGAEAYERAQSAEKVARQNWRRAGNMFGTKYHRAYEAARDGMLDSRKAAAALALPVASSPELRCLLSLPPQRPSKLRSPPARRTPRP
ncbi:hypothetical protein [Pyxidicoccus sp. MSG2]|uniref:hypothetical protein n=1 Tax=Pyxidicoccus sp. MSG2 TaxID=2996790 RepID=UPI0022702516|nr:hypothetical protein [Pyxidicoccus sp. MSG2]MCY1024047.1 hypothetical protein [Pyxidicoccus sp. MSG2]